MRARLALIVVIAAVGCYHDKYNVNGPPREDYLLPPDQKRYNEPDTAPYRPPPMQKKEDTLMNKNKQGGGGLGGF